MKKIFKLFKSGKLSKLERTEKVLHLKAAEHDRDRLIEVYHSLNYHH